MNTKRFGSELLESFLGDQTSFLLQFLLFHAQGKAKYNEENRDELVTPLLPFCF